TMRLSILFATALATSSTVFAAHDSQGPVAIQKRQGIVGTIQNGINDAIQNVQDLFAIGHAGEDSSADTGNNNGNNGNNNNNGNGNGNNNAESTPTTPVSPTTKSSSETSKTSTSSQPTTESSKDSSPDANTDDSTKTTKSSSTTTTKDSDKTTDSNNDNTDDNSEPTPTGDACSTEGEKKCDSSGSSSYSLCQDGYWISQKCGGSNICGTDSLGAIACIDKDATVVQLESCSKKNQQRCSSSDPTKYQTCDGKHWQNYSCDGGNQCTLTGNKVVCGSADGGSPGGSAYDPGSYSQISQVAFVPQSHAGRSAPLVFSLLAFAVGAGLYM
ncbi:hypothetical protein LPJ73_008552, partial [Coemansia sp. RSA 2703]